jgi:hypothetical protein
VPPTQASYKDMYVCMYVCMYVERGRGLEEGAGSASAMEWMIVLLEL